MQNGERAPAAAAASCPPWSYHASDQIRVCSLDHSLCGHLTTRKRNPATLAQQRKAGCKGGPRERRKNSTSWCCTKTQSFLYVRGPWFIQNSVRKTTKQQRQAMARNERITTAMTEDAHARYKQSTQEYWPHRDRLQTKRRENDNRPRGRAGDGR